MLASAGLGKPGEYQTRACRNSFFRHCPGRGRVMGSKGSSSGSLKVSSLAENLSQILVASASTDTSGTAMMVERIMQVCRQAGVECSPE